MDTGSLRSKEEPPEENMKASSCCVRLWKQLRHPCSSGDARWTLLRFSVLCLLAILILITVHAARSSGDASHKGKTEGLYGVGDPIYPRDLWLIIDLPSDALGLRTSLGKGSIEHVCGAIKAGQAVGWTPLVIGGKAECCRSHCHHLSPPEIPKMNHSISKHYLETVGDVSTALRTAGFLQAIERGAHFIFHASPDVYFSSGLSPRAYRSELERQLRRMTLGISIGLLSSEPGPRDPYAHFGQFTQDNSLNKSLPYKICELRPPSLEKFLESSSSYPGNVVAPPLTVSGGPRSPFDSRNTLFSRDAFLTLLFLPKLKGSSALSREELQREAAVLRSILAQALLKVLAGSTKFSISAEPLKSNLSRSSLLGPDLKRIQSLLLDWNCPGGGNSAFQCLKELLSFVSAKTDLLGKEHLEMNERWLRDLSASGYGDFSTLPSASPCIGSESLPGVLFAAPSPPGSLSLFCPSVDFSKGSEWPLRGPGSSLLLIISFTDAEDDYESIGLFETVYRASFPNILYCGPPNAGAEDLNESLRSSRGRRGFSFLPVASGQAFECALGAIEMGYNVDGFLVLNARTFILSWNFKNLSPNVIWHGNEHARVLDAQAINALDSNNERIKVIRSIHGLVKTFNFLKKVLDSASRRNEGAGILEKEDKGPWASRNATQEDVTLEYPLEEEVEPTEDFSDEELLVEHPGGLHLNIFGEINEDGGNSSSLLSKSGGLLGNKNLTELIFHPANFKDISRELSGPPLPSSAGKTIQFISRDLQSLQAIYADILKRLRALQEEHGLQQHFEDESSSCRESINPEICRLVRTFFSVLESNDGSQFSLVYDDLPIYYVPLRNMHKDELYLMANLFTKYSVDNEIAFPLLLRGLSHQGSWEPLKRSFLVNKSTSPESLQDLILQEKAPLEDGPQNLERAHYIYPVNMTSVLRNDVIRNMICKKLS